MDALPTLAHDSRVARGWHWLALRALGALALLPTGAVHLHEYKRFYSAVPTIGTLFVLNFVGATSLALALLAPLERIGGRYGSALLVLAAVGRRARRDGVRLPLHQRADAAVRL